VGWYAKFAFIIKQNPNKVKTIVWVCVFLFNASVFPVKDSIA
jgi:hypothetical protein